MSCVTLLTCLTRVVHWHSAKNCVIVVHMLLCVAQSGDILEALGFRCDVLGMPLTLDPMTCGTKFVLWAS